MPEAVLNPFCKDYGGNCDLRCICKLTSRGSCGNTINCKDQAVSGTLPTQIGLLSVKNHLFLSGNSISGTIPTTIATLLVSKKLELDGNLLSGTVPSELVAMASPSACSFVPSGTPLFACPHPSECASGTCSNNGCAIGGCQGATVDSQVGAMVVMTFNVDRATFEQQRNTYLANAAAYLGVSATRLSLEFEPEVGTDAAGSTTSARLTILPAMDEGGDTEPAAEDAAALLTASDRALLSTVLDVEVLEVKANGAALEATSQSEEEFPVAAVVVPIVGVIAALGGLACVYVMLRRKLSSLSTTPIVVMKGIHTNYYPSDVNKVPTMTKPTYAPATTVSGRERGYSTI